MGETLKWQEYKCHKVVQAVKITEAVFTEGNDQITIVSADSSVPAFAVTKDWWVRRSAKVGGYAVLYKDGYMSWSPAKEFEDGYTKVEDNGPGNKPCGLGPRFHGGSMFCPHTVVSDTDGNLWWISEGGKLSRCEIDRGNPTTAAV